jgi:hypothetical protein
MQSPLQFCYIGLARSSLLDARQRYGVTWIWRSVHRIGDRGVALFYSPFPSVLSHGSPSRLLRDLTARITRPSMLF